LAGKRLEVFDSFMAQGIEMVLQWLMITKKYLIMVDILSLDYYFYYY